MSPRNSPNDWTLPAAAIRALDQEAIHERGIPALILMENAGCGAFRMVRDLARAHGAESVICVAGKGNNGGDAMVVARHALNEGLQSRLVLLEGEAAYSPNSDAGLMLRAARGTGVEIVDARTTSPELALLGHERAVLVDGILGTGSRGAPRGACASWIMAMNECAAPIVALDLPSGLDADEGIAIGACIEAQATVCFAVLKKGLVRADGPRCAGRIEVIAISIPIDLLQRARQSVEESL